MPDPVSLLDKSALEAGFRIGDFLVEPLLQRITGDEPVQVEPRVMEVLVRLAEQPGRPVSKEEFFDDLWGGLVVTDDALLRCIGELRRTLGDNARAPRYIETIRKRGYRLIAPVTLDAVELALEALAPEAAAPEVTTPEASAPEAVTPEALPSGSATPERGPDAPTEAVAPASVAQAPEATRPRRFWVGAAALAGLIVILSALVIWSGRQTETPAPAPLVATPLTSYPGVERDPSLSPNGEAVAFVWDGGDGGPLDLYVQQVGVGSPLRLTDTPGDEASPSWSPDGQQLAFARGDAVYAVPVIGGSERRLVSLGGRAVQDVAWSPDGATLVLSAETEPRGPLGLWTLSLATLRPEPLTSPPSESEGDRDPAFSPDGLRLAFVRSTTERVDDIYLLSLSGDESEERLTEDYAEVSGLDWTRDGSRIVFSSDRGGGSALWMVPASGGTPTWLPTSGGGRGVYQPTTARESGRLGFVQREEEANIWTVPLDSAGTAPDRPLVTSTRWDSHPALSPDGRRLAFVSNRSGPYEVWVSSADGSDPYPATTLGGPFVTTPRWSPDGQRIAFVAKIEGSADVYVVDASGGQPVRITTAESNDRAPAWSRDGRTLYFASSRSGRWEVWKRPADGSGTTVQVTDDGAFSAQESPDGQTLYTTRREADGLWRRPIGGGRPLLVIPTLQANDWANWAVTASGVYAVQRDANEASLYLWDSATGARERIAGLERFPTHPALAVAVNGQRVVATRLDRDDSDLFFAEDID